jgi:hypothetical protein
MYEWNDPGAVELDGAIAKAAATPIAADSGVGFQTSRRIAIGCKVALEALQDLAKASAIRRVGRDEVMQFPEPVLDLPTLFHILGIEP